MTTRPTPTTEHAVGMLHALTASHECTTACTGITTLGDGSRLQLRCPYALLDVTVPLDRRIIASLYAHDALSALHPVGTVGTV